MKTIEKYLLIFIVGGLGYAAIEIAFRGYTHWSMVITGGSAFLCLYIINNAFHSSHIITKSLMGAVIITVLELTVGLVVNRKFGMGVWNYSETPFNFLGIISLPFSFAWFVLSFILINFINITDKLLHSLNSENLNTVRSNC